MQYSNNIQLVILMFITICNAKSYRGYSLIHASPNNDAILEFFNNLERFYNATYWKKPSFVHKPALFSISRVHLAELRRDTSDMNIDFHTVIRDLQRVFDKQTIKPYIRRQMESFGWDSYHSIDDIYSWVTDLRTTNPREVDVSTIGQTFESRNILLVKVMLDGRKGRLFCQRKLCKMSVCQKLCEKKFGEMIIPPRVSMRHEIMTINFMQHNSEPFRPKIMVEGGCHAREWMSVAFVTYLINEIVNAKSSTNAELKKIANYYEWHFVPVMNPDGYDYSQRADRLWRKNCRGGYGVDLNRNFGIAFGKLSTSLDDKNHGEYCGSSAFSEKETAALSAYARDNRHNLEYYISFHAFGQYIVIPFASSADHRDNYNEVKRIADRAARVSSSQHGIVYTTGTAYDTVGYLASGVSSDWMKQSLNISYVVTFELPDQGKYGFAMPPNKILPTCEATMDLVLAFLTPQTKGHHELRYGTPGNGVMENTHFGRNFLIFYFFFLWFFD